MVHCCGDGKSSEVGHDVAVGSGVVRSGNEDVDAGLRDSLGVSGRILGEDGVVLRAQVWQLRGDSHLKSRAAKAQSGDSHIRAHCIGNVDLLRAETLGNADVPLAAYDVPGGGDCDRMCPAAISDE